MYALRMDRIFAWNPEKNRKLINERGISFEAIVWAIENGQTLDILSGQGKFSHQKQYVVEINDYAYVVPFVEDEKKIFLKTIMPSRRMTKHYLGGNIQ